MNHDLLARVLQGDEAAISEFGEAEHCAVIDWRDGIAEIVEAVGAFLPNGHLSLVRSGQTECELLVQGKARQPIPLSASIRQEQLLLRVSEALKPAFELRQFRPFDGDGYSILVAPGAVWADLESTHPRETERLFLTAERLAAYWSKGYLARLFSKP